MAEKKSVKKEDKKKKEEKKEIEEITEKDFDSNEIIEFKGKYIKAIGRRKSAVAQVRLYEKGKGIIVVNGSKLNQYFPGDALSVVTQPLKALSKLRDFNFSIIVKGGGKKGQAEACRLGISRVLLSYDEEYRDALKVNGFLTRDPRRKERKKPGLKKARKRPQWSKR